MFSADFSPSRGRGSQLLGAQVVEVRDVVQESVFVEQLDGLLTQPLDVHRLAADEVDDAADDLGPASALVGAVVLRFALVAHQRRAALGTAVDVDERPAVGGTHRQLHARDLGDDLAALLDVDHVAGTDVELRHLLGVVQRGPPHGGAGQQHRVEVRHGGDGASAPHLEVDAGKSREGLLGLELVGHGPLRSLCRGAQPPPQGEVVDLHHYAVGGEGQLPARFVPMTDEGVDFGRRAADARLIRDFESPCACLRETLPVVREGEFVARQLIERAVEAAARHDGRRLLLERAGRGVARIGEERLARGLAFGVEAVERGVGHQDLAPDLEQLGPPFALEPQGHRAHGADVGRHIIARFAVAARHGPLEAAVLVGERDGRAVELQFADELRGTRLAFDAFDEFVQFVERVGVAQRLHGEAVAHGAELRRRVAAHAHRRRRGVGELGMRRLQILQFAHQRVELEVGDLGGVLDVVFAVVVLEPSAQLLDPLLYHMRWRVSVCEDTKNRVRKQAAVPIPDVRIFGAGKGSKNLRRCASFARTDMRREGRLATF